MSQYKLRDYQEHVVEKIGHENAIVKMPTGSGKTFVAAEFIKRGLIKRGLAKTAKKIDDDSATVATEPTTGSSSLCPKSTVSSSSHMEAAALFLVPTCDLVSQQKRAVEAWIGYDCEVEVAEYMGSKACPTKRFDVLVSTPQAFLTLQQNESSKNLFAWSNFFCCIFDECHHVLKEHPYRIIAHRIKAWRLTNSQRIQVVGLSASLTYAVGHRAVEEALKNLCDDLDVTKMISPSEEELMLGGYVPQDDVIETMHKPWDVPKGVLDENERKPHLMHEIFMRRIEMKEATQFALKVYTVVKNIENEIEYVTGEAFQTPLGEIRLGKWAESAYKKKEESATGSIIEVLYKLLEVWYVALRMVCQSWEEEEQFVLQWLLIQDGFQYEGWFGPRLISSINAVYLLHQSGGIQSEKLMTLKRHLIEKRKRKGITFRGIIFVKQRISAYVLAQHLNNDRGCLEHGIRADYVTARNARISPSIKVTPGEATKRIEKFRNGNINLIIATSVIEEGFDVPEANVVISYDDVKDTVELCQRFGRARNKASSLTLMSERKDRPLAALKEVKKHQDSIIKDFNPSQSKQHAISRQQSQNDRERASSSVLKDISRCERSPLECLNMYAAKTKAVADIEYVSMGPNRMFQAKMTYKAMSRTVDGSGEAQTKKKAQHAAALSILKQLREDDRRRGLI